MPNAHAKQHRTNDMVAETSSPHYARLVEAQYDKYQHTPAWLPRGHRPTTTSTNQHAEA